MKYVKFFVAVFPKVLSIVPYWNWNAIHEKVGAKFKSSQSYHTGIEIYLNNETKLIAESLNRTILELKCISIDEYISERIDSQSYHTGIEIIKQMTDYDLLTASQSYHTGIEILEYLLRRGFDKTLNRTILELKLWIKLFFSLLGSLSIVPYWNWNQDYRHYRPHQFYLSIVPYWNWNFDRVLNPNPDLFSQSYHTGIEIKKQILNIVPIIDSQSYHTGIEIRHTLLSRNPAKSSQSYHTGIEIVDSR